MWALIYNKLHFCENINSLSNAKKEKEHKIEKIKKRGAPQWSFFLKNAKALPQKVPK